MRKLLIAVGIVLLLLLAADRLVKIVAEREAERRIQQTYGLAERPNVTVHGFPFLTQLVRRELQRVDLVVDNMAAGTVDGLDVDVTARRIEILPGYEGRAESVAGTLLIPYEDLGRLAEASGSPPVTIEYGGEPGLIMIRAPIDLPTGMVDVVGFSELRLDGREVSVRLSRLEVEGATAPAVVREVVGDQFDLTVTLPEVPGAAQVSVDSVEARPDGVAVDVSGRDVAVG